MNINHLHNQDHHHAQIHSEEDLASLPPDDSARTVIAELIQHLITETLHTEYPYEEESDGFIALIQPEDVHGPLADIWPDWGLLDIPWEGITLKDGFFHAVFLANI